MTESDLQAARAATLDWVHRIVIGLDLCPFARAPLAGGRLRVTVTTADEASVILTELWSEVELLLSSDPSSIETTLFVVPQGLASFDAFLDTVDVANALLQHQQLEGVVQLAHFHPDYCFAGEPADDPANATNRSPYPTFHVLREASVSRAVAAHPSPEDIPERNVARLRKLGAERIQQLRTGDPSEA